MKHRRLSLGGIPGKGMIDAVDESEDTIMMWGYGFNWFGMTFIMLGSTLWILLLVALTWALIRWLNHRTNGQTRRADTMPERGLTAGEILRQRYARGEIDAATFEQMRERLEGSDALYQESWRETTVR